MSRNEIQYIARTSLGRAPTNKELLIIEILQETQQTELGYEDRAAQFGKFEQTV